MSMDNDRERELLTLLRDRLLYYKEIGVRDVRCPRAAPHEPDSIDRAARTSTLSVSPHAPPIVIHRSEAAAMEGLFSERFTLPPDADRALALEELRCQEIGECTRCKLSRGRTNVVFGSGNPRARLMFIGEGPGADEDAQGLPFVGRAGQKLTEMIEKGMDIPRSEVYIANIVKCRPPGNRDPEPDEIAACEGFLFKQIDIVRPRVIVALGRFAAQTLLRTKLPISALRGKFWKVRDTLMMPTFHPAFLLRQYTPENRRIVWEDLKKVKDALEAAEA